MVPESHRAVKWGCSRAVSWCLLYAAVSLTTFLPSTVLPFTPTSFASFRFAPNGVCVSPRWFHDGEGRVFSMRNVPGEGDCMFLAVALAAATSMGVGGNDALLRSISRETRQVVAQVLQSEGNLHIEGNRIVKALDLLKSATSQLGLGANTEAYIELLEKEGREGGLYGGGPELTVLANVLRRPISIYELDKPREEIVGEGGGEVSDVERSSAHKDTRCQILQKGVFGRGLFEDPCASIPNSAVLTGIQPGAYSWHLHILVVDVSEVEKHACVLLPQAPIA